MENIFFNEILYLYINKTALIAAVEKENTEILKILLANKDIDINCIIIIIQSYIKFYEMIL